MKDKQKNKEDLLKELKELKLEISGYKLTGQLLVDSETRYRRLFESAKDGILILDAETGKIVDVNPFLTKLLGYSREQFIEKNLWEIGLFKDEAANYDNFLELQQKKYIRYENLPLETATGRKINVEFVSNVYLVNHNKVIQCNIRDISERIRNATELRSNNSKLELAMNVANMAWWEMDIVTGNVTFDKRKAEMLGYPPEKFKHYRDFTSLLHPEDYDKAMNAMRGHIEGKLDKYEVEYRILTSKKEYKWFYDIGSIVKKDSKGVPLKVIGLVLDISERVMTENALVESERLSAIGEMSAAVAHDFNNSLQVIIGNLEMALIAPKISGNLIKLIKAAKRSAGDAASRIMHLQHITQKVNSSNYSALDINKLLSEIIIQTRPIWKDEAEKKGTKIKFLKSFGKVVTIDGDYGELRIVFHNIIKNAVEAMPDGGTITLETGVKAKNVFIRISDTGTGMDEETKKRIFQPFFTTKGFEGGRGLGLSGVYSIMKGHNGSIKIIDTKIGKGTLLELLFPSGKLNAENHLIKTKSIPTISLKVLWVDDDEDLRDIEKEVMESLGHVIDHSKLLKELEVLKLEIRNLKSSKKKDLAKSNEIKNRFISTMSHELRTHLSIILSTSDFLESAELNYGSEKKMNHFLKIRRNVDNIANILNNVLLINEIDSYKIKVSANKINLADFCSVLFSDIKLLYPTITSELVINLKDNLQNVNEVLMRYILENLISNAFKYNSISGKVTFKVNLINKKLVYDIIDTGIGIPIKEQKKLFKPFPRISNTYRMKGSGLGLSIIKSSVDMLGGKVSYKSKENRGSTFTVKIPII